MKNIGFVGVGNMSSQIINGLNDSNLDIKMFGSNHSHVNEHVKDFTDRKVLTMIDDVNELVKTCDYIIFGVPAKLVDSILQNIDKKLITDDKVFMSVAAGITLEQYSKDLNDKARFVRVMPNVNAAVKESMTALCANHNVTNEEKEFSEKLFDQVGKTIWLDEKLFDIFMPIAGSFPAMIFMLIDALNKVAVEYGMDKKLATEIAIQTIAGSTEYAKVNGLDKNIDMSTLVSTVASPGGTTINGVDLLNKENFDELIKQTIVSMMKPKDGEK